MEKEWSELTPEEKREIRFLNWLKPDNITFKSPEAKRAYEERVKRLIAVIKLEEPDRVPVICHPGFVPAPYSGYTIKEVMYDSEKLTSAWNKYMDDFEHDVLPDASLVMSGEAMETVGAKTSKWAGYGLPDNASFQYVETEVLKAHEWDYFEKDPSDFNLRVMLPRTYGAAEPFTKLPPLSMLGGYGIPAGVGTFASPDVQSGFQAFAKAEKIGAEWRKAILAIENRGLSMGLPNFFEFEIAAGAPLDAIGAGLRGTRGTVMDMFQQPERILSYMEKQVQMITGFVTTMAKREGSPVRFMPLHRGADGFMSEEQFNTFYWPYLKRVVEAYINEGLVPLLFAEGGYNSRLEIIRELPAKGVIWYFDQTDLVRAKEILGDRACIMGNIPTSMMVTGTPGEVKARSKELIDVVGKGGGYILAPGATSDEAKPSNLRALHEAAKEYGRY